MSPEALGGTATHSPTLSEMKKHHPKRVLRNEILFEFFSSPERPFGGWLRNFYFWVILQSNFKAVDSQPTDVIAYAGPDQCLKVIIISSGAHVVIVVDSNLINVITSQS